MRGGIYMNQIHPIPEEHLPRCSSCTGCWDNHDTGCYCRYGQEPGKCEGPKESKSSYQVSIQRDRGAANTPVAPHFGVEGE